MRPGALRRAAWTGLAGILAGTVALAVAPPAQAAVTVREVYGRPANGVFQLLGHGWGHGRGMSQYGGQGAATLGKTADEITAKYYPGTAKASISNYPMRVQLRSNTDAGKSVVHVVSGLTATDLATGTKLNPPAGATRWRVTLDGSGMRLASFDGSVWTVHPTAFTGPIQFGGPAVVRLAFPTGGGGSEINARDYRGAIRVIKTSATTLQNIAVMPMESYLLGVVPRESPSSFKAAALQAQSIAARSYSAYKHDHAPSSQAYDICDTTACQVFGGTRLYRNDGTSTPLEVMSTSDAVKATAGVVRTYQGAPIFAEFSASNGGWSTDGSVPYLIAQPDPWDGVTGSSVHSWKASLPVSALESYFRGLGTFRRLTITERDGNGEWGGRVLKVLLEGVDGAGNPTSVTATGSQVFYSQQWPAKSSGLRGRWFFIVPEYAGALVSRSSAPRLVHSPGEPRGTLTAVLQNTGSGSWPADSVHLALTSPAGGADPLAGGSTRPGAFVRNLTSPGSTLVLPGERAEFAVPLDATRAAVGTYSKSYRLRVGSGAQFGHVATWAVRVENPVYAAAPAARATSVATTLAPREGAPAAVFADGRTVVVPRTGSTTVRLSLRNAGNLSWPVGAQSPLRLATSAARGRISPSAGPGWISGSRVVGASAAAPVTPAQAATFDVPLHGNRRAAGVTSESFEGLWEGKAWLAGSAQSLTVVRVDTGVSRAAVTHVAPSTGFTMVNAPTGTTNVYVRMRNVGNDPWTVGQENLRATTSAPLAAGWPSAGTPPALQRNLSRPGATAVHPGEIGQWVVPLSAYKKAPGTYRMTLRAISPSGGLYGPSYAITTKVVAANFSYALTSVKPRINVPRNGTAVHSFYVKNTGNVVWPVGAALRSVVRASSSPSYASTWLSATRPAALSANHSRRGSTVVRPGEIARFDIRLAGNGRTPRTTSEVFGMVWDTWRHTTLRVTLAYRVV